jgi:nucleoside-diphosphate-sugar epimerase
MIHRADSKRDVEGLGATAFLGDVLEPETVDTALRDCDLVIHVATASALGPGGARAAERVRVGGCQNLLRSARRHGVRRLVVGSGYWVYADTPDTITEESSLDPRGESLINRKTELAALDPVAQGPVEVLVVRPGMVYGDGSWFRTTVDAIRNGPYRYIGDGLNAWSFVSLKDAGRGFARVAETGVPGEVYNLVDGRPVSWKEFGDFVADRLSCPRPSSLSPSAADAEYGPDVSYHLRARRACSSAKIERLGWRPRIPDVRAGVSALLSP